MNWIFSLHISNLNFTGYSRQKNPVQTRKKSSSSNSIFQTGELQKLGADRQGGMDAQKWGLSEYGNTLTFMYS